MVRRIISTLFEWLAVVLAWSVVHEQPRAGQFIYVYLHVMTAGLNVE